MLLAFETVARTASACVCADDGTVTQYRDLAGGEAEIGLVRMLQELIETHGRPSAVAVAAGPGSFTGLRIGVTAARTLGWIDAVPVHPVDSLRARALQQGDGLWWVLMPLKRDTFFHGLFEVVGGRIEALVETVAVDDAAEPAPHPRLREATAIGALVGARPRTIARWCPQAVLGSPAGLDARGVALAARLVPAVPWNLVLPDYHQDAAPVLQRARALLSTGIPATAIPASPTTDHGPRTTDT